MRRMRKPHFIIHKYARVKTKTSETESVFDSFPAPQPQSSPMVACAASPRHNCNYVIGFSGKVRRRPTWTYQIGGVEKALPASERPRKLYWHRSRLQKNKWARSLSRRALPHALEPEVEDDGVPLSRWHRRRTSTQLLHKHP